MTRRFIDTRRFFGAVIALLLVSSIHFLNASSAAAAACTPPTTPLGVTTGSVRIKASGTHRIVVNMSAPNTSNNSVLLQLDSTTCFLAGDSSTQPVNRYSNVDYRNGSTTTKMTASLSAGTHTFKIYGRERDVRVDFLTFVHPTAANNVTVQAESATSSGNAQIYPTPTPAGTRAVQYSSPAPSGLRTIAGGNSVALQWNALAGTKNYLVFRNGAQIATVTPSTTNYSNVSGTRYYDKTAVKGTTYSYQIRALDGSNVLSLLSPAVSAVIPLTTTPVPTINLDYSQAPDLAGWMENHARPTLEAWYPKIADRIVGGAYSVPASTTVRVDPTVTNVVAYTWNDEIVINADWVRTHLDDIGLLVHEGTHLVQAGGGNPVPPLVIEGVADWTREIMFKDRAQTPPSANQVYTEGYATGAYFLNWVTTKYAKPNFVRDMNVARHNGQFTYDFFVQQTGKPVQQLWYEMTSRRLSAAQPMVGYANQCLDVPFSIADNGRQLQLWYDCNGSPAQQVIVGFNAAGTGGDLHVLGKCVDAAFSGTEDGTVVQVWECNGTGAQQWEPQPDGTVKNVNSGKCLDVDGDPLSGSAKLVLWTCDPAKPGQQWTFPNTV